MKESSASMERLKELLAEEATGGLEPGAGAELEELMAADTELKRDEFMMLASLVQVGLLHRDQRSQQHMPDALREKLAQQARDFFGQTAASNDPAPAVTDIRVARQSREKTANRASRWFRTDLTGWYLAAALAIAFVVFRSGVPTDAAMDPVERRAALLDARDTIVAPWAPAAAADGYGQVTGDVVWNNREQAGYLRLAGLAANSPATAQYQLWIVDPERDERPVDGGVFDVPAGQSIRSPAAFAITLEQPGGVVVSGGPLLVVAPVAG
jgi:hypothetical protein